MSYYPHISRLSPERKHMFNIFKSNHMERLVDELGRVLQEVPESVFEPQLVSVQSLGMRQWLSMRLAEKLRICANIDFPFPRDLVSLLFERGLDLAESDSEVLDVEHLTWLTMSVLPTLLEEKEFSQLKNFLEPAGHDTKRDLRLFHLSKKIADTFDQYTIYRPDVIKSWDSGHNPEWIHQSFSWQYVLWKKITENMGPFTHIPAMADAFVKAASEHTMHREKLPKKICLFGITTLPPLFVDILHAASQYVDIDLFFLSPSKEFWTHVRSRREILRQAQKQGLSIDDMDKLLHMEEGHPLLASLGRMGREFQWLLETKLDYAEPAGDLFEDDHPRSGPSVLSSIQSDILHLRKTSHRKLQGPDDSVTFHSCHSELREVEVVKDQLREIFENNHHIHPHDVVVMTPDIEKYAPLIDAVFGTLEGKAKIPYSISDRSIAQQAPVIEAFMALVDMANARTSIVQVLDLLSHEPIMKRFDLTNQEVEQVHRWASESGVRWGKNAKHRESFHQPGVEQNTWRFGLDRLFLGLAMPSQDRIMFNGRMPFDELEGTDAELLGKFAEFFQVLSRFQIAMERPRTPADWQKILEDLMESLTSDQASFGFFHQHIREVIGELSHNAQLASFESEISVEVIKDYLKGKFTQGSSQRFMSGGVTFCKLLPMRSIPHKVVCLMGMNDKDYPRVQCSVGFDLIARHPRPADRSMRQDDRYQFLEALLSAREKFLVTYVGQDIYDNHPLAPSTLVYELQDYMDSMAQGNESFSSMTRPVMHPLHPFSPRYFQPGTGLFSYDPEYFKAAQCVHDNAPEPLFFKQPISKYEISVLELSDLVNFFSLPVKHLLNKRLGIYLPPDKEQDQEREPMELDGLEKYQMGQWLLSYLVEDQGARDGERILAAKGVLPPGQLGRYEFDELLTNTRSLADVLREKISGVSPRWLDVDISLGRVMLSARIDNIFQDSQIIAGYQKIGPRRLCHAWIRHLVLLCSGQMPSADTTILLGRGDDNSPHIVNFGYVDNPQQTLRDMVDIYLAGQREPLPLFPKTSFAHAASTDKEIAKSFLSILSSEKQWYGANNFQAESQEPHTNLVFGNTEPWSLANRNPDLGFSSLAFRVFGPILEHLRGSGE